MEYGGAGAAAESTTEEIVWSARAGSHLEVARRQAGLRRRSLEATDWPVRRESAHDLPPLARRLRHEREGRGATQAVVGWPVGVPQATVSRWNGRNRLALRNLQRLADALKVPYDDVVAAAAVAT